MEGRPRALRPGDRIGVVAPAGPVEAERLARGAAELERLGFLVTVAEGVLERASFTAGSVESRLRQLHSLFADTDVRAIACARGGAGLLHLLPLLDRELLRSQPKILLGYSDVTLLHLLLGQLGLTSLHGPMVARDLADGAPAYDRQSLWQGLTGEGAPWASGPGLRALRDGDAVGTLRGGCLSLLAAVAGTPWALRTAGEPTILFLEDVDEAPYRIDRMLRQLRLSGALAGVRGLVLGEMRGCSPAAGAGYTLEDVVLEALAGFEGPIAAGLPSGHVRAPNVTVPLGVVAQLVCADGRGRVEAREAPVR